MIGPQPSFLEAPGNVCDDVAGDDVACDESNNGAEDESIGNAVISAVMFSGTLPERFSARFA